MNSIVSAASGRSCSSSTTRARGSSRGGGWLRGSAGRPPRASPKATTRRPGGGVLLERALEPGGSSSAPACGEHVGRPHHVAAGDPRPSRVMPLHFHADENGHLGDDALRLARVALGDRLQGPVALARRVRRSGPAPRGPPPAAACRPTSTETRSSVPSVSVPVLSTQIVSTAASASVAAICWTSVFIRARRTAATARVTLISSTRPSGISVTRPAVAVCAASWKSALRSAEREQQEDRQRHHHDRGRAQDPVDLELERRRAGGGSARASPATFSAWLSSRTASTS